MKVYIAGAIINNPRYKEQFAEAERILTEEGHIVFNPAKNTGENYKEYIDMGLYQLMHCEAIYLLKGYALSAGAMLELHYASTTGMTIWKDKNMEVHFNGKIYYFEETEELEQWLDDHCDDVEFK